MLPCWSQPRWKIWTNRTSRSASRRASRAQRANVPGLCTSGPYMSRMCLGSFEMSISSGTEVCIRKAISYWAIRAWVSGSAIDSYSRWLSRLMASSERRRVAASTPGGIRQEEHRIALRAEGHSLVLAGQEARGPEPVVQSLGGRLARPGRGHHHEGRQVLVHRAQAVAEP